MKHFLAAAMAAIALGVAAPASAADLAAPVHVPPPADAMYNWSGFYIGANAGGGSSHGCATDIIAGGLLLLDQGCNDATGGVAGAQIGYRWQSSSWVLGLEAQGDWAGLKGSNAEIFSPAFTNRSNVNAFGLFTAQVGYATNNVLFYLKGGAAVTNNHFDVFSVPSNLIVANTPDQTRWGTTLGAGLEYGFAPNWSLGIEYDHLFMPDQTSIFIPTVPALPAETSITQGVDVVMARLNYRFGD